MQKIKQTIGDKLREWFSVDYRSLAVLRIGVGFAFLFDVIQRACDFRAFYSDAGVLPRETLLHFWSNQWWVSLHMSAGAPAFEAMLLIIAGIAALSLILGYRTRLVMVVSWFLLVSIHVRNPLILQGGDILFRAIAFWMMFLPLNRAWSLDRLFNTVPAPKEKTYFGTASIAYLVQICLLYIFTGVLKSGEAWHNGTAVYYALNVDQLITPIGAYLREFPHVMSMLTYATWYLEVYGVLLFFSPVATGFFRTLGIFLFACLQIGFNSSMRLGLFGFIAVVVTLGLLPSNFWDFGFARFTDWIARKGKTGLTIYYDFECGFCHKTSILFKRLFLLHPDTKIVPAHSNPEVEKVMLEKNSWVIVDHAGGYHTTWDGGVTIVSYSPVFFWLKYIAVIPGISHLGEKVYRLLSEKRHQVCKVEPPERKATAAVLFGRTVRDLVLAFLVIYVIAWNLDTLPTKAKIITNNMKDIGWATHLDQQFNMFAPYPLTEDGWYVFPGRLRDGSGVDVFTGKESITYSKPAWVAYTYKNQRWQKYLMNLWNKDYSEYRLPYGQYLCREWNRTHPEDKQLMNFDMIFMLENTPKPNEPQSPVVPTTIWSHSCF
jgi:hypothetical protein